MTRIFADLAVSQTLYACTTEPMDDKGEVKNVSGSTAGACSGDFHVYRHQRRREMERVEKMEREAQTERERNERVAVFRQLQRKEDMKTDRRIAKRRRAKQRRAGRTMNKRGGDDGVCKGEEEDDKRHDVCADGNGGR